MEKYKLKIIEIIKETENIHSFKIEKPSNFNFFPGQFCWLNTESEDVNFTPMAIASGILENELKFTVRVWGDTTKALFNLKEGDILTVSEPQGTGIPLNILSTKKVIGIAGGTGITPIRSLIFSRTDKSLTEVAYGAKESTDLLYKNELSKLSINSYLTTEKEEPGFHNGLVTDLLSKIVPANENSFYFIVGPNPMITAVLSKLYELKVPTSHIFLSVEKFVNRDVFGPVFPLEELVNLRQFLVNLLPE